MCVCVYICAHAHAVLLVWRHEGNLEELVLSLYHVVPGIQIQVLRLGGKCLYSVKLSFKPWLYF